MIWWLHTNPSKTALDRSMLMLEGFIWSHLSITMLMSPSQSALTGLFFCKWEFFILFFLDMLTYSINFTNFLWCHNISSLIYCGLDKNKNFQKYNSTWSLHTKLSTKLIFNIRQFFKVLFTIPIAIHVTHYFLHVADNNSSLTAGAPSISSITKQFGFSLYPSTDLICVEASIVFLNTSCERSSLSKN